MLQKYNAMGVWLTKIRCPLLDNQVACFVAGAGCCWRWLLLAQLVDKSACPPREKCRHNKQCRPPYAELLARVQIDRPMCFYMSIGGTPAGRPDARHLPVLWCRFHPPSRIGSTTPGDLMRDHYPVLGAWRGLGKLDTFKRPWSVKGVWQHHR